MLDLMLGNGDDCFSTGEFYGLFTEREIGCSCLRGENCSIWHSIRGLGEEKAHRNLSKITGCAIISDSSKNMRWINEHHSPSDHVVVIYKHPLNYLYSCYKRDHRSPWQILLRLWNWWTYYPTILRKHPKATVVSYRDLATQPSEVLREICSIVGVKYFPDKKFFWEGIHHILYGSGSARTHLYNRFSDLYRKRVGEEVEFHQSIYYTDRWKTSLPKWWRKLFFLVEDTYQDLEDKRIGGVSR